MGRVTAASQETAEIIGYTQQLMYYKSRGNEMLREPTLWEQLT
jgi:hypothetical protein